jgi:predicted Holliday junction resolvase-like endonuclease
VDPFILIAAGLALLLAVSWVLWAKSMASMRRKLRELDATKRSQSTRYGQTMEQFAPFLQDWPWDPKLFRFIGSPIDGIQFTPEGVVFVEIKSAASRLSPIQQQVRDHVQAGRVAWKEVRID